MLKIGVFLKGPCHDDCFCLKGSNLSQNRQNVLGENILKDKNELHYQRCKSLHNTSTTLRL
jgi:hypothetical protein